MALELKITSPSPEGFVKEILWNADEISKEIDEKLGYYKNLVYTDEQIVEAKKDRAALNKFIAALKAKDSEIKKLCLAPYEAFHARMLQIIKKVEEPAAMIDKQVKGFEEKQKHEKMTAILELFKAKGFQPWVTLEKIWDPTWLNKSCSLKKVDEALGKIQYRIGEDIFLINRQGDGVQAALSEYKRSLDVRKAVAAAEHYIEARNAEEKLKASIAPVVGMEAADEEIPGQVRLEDVMNAPEPAPAAEPARATAPAEVPNPMNVQNELSETVPMRKEIFFKVVVSREELAALNTYLKSNGIIFRQIKNR